jgi:YD repeat-containing protein
MKKIITIVALLVLGFTNAQIAKYKASDFNLSADVTKYEDQEFYFDSGLNKYQLSNARTIYLNKGLVTKIENKSNYFMYMESTNTFNYKNGLLQSIHIKTQMGEYTENFSYKKDKIVEKKDTDSRTTYEYDNKGNLSKETKFEKEVLVEKLTYSNYTSPNSYTKKSIKYSNNEEDQINEQIIKNGLLISEKNTTKYSTLSETYQYDKNRNQTQYTRDENVFKNSYQYDSKGNILRSQVQQLDFDTQENINYFTFAKVTYANGKTAGNTDFDVNYVKKYDANSPSYEVTTSFDGASAEELNKAIQDLQALLNYNYKIKKNQDNSFVLKDANGEEITNDVEAVKSKNDILVYDILFKKSVLLKNFYNDEVKVGEWYNMEELASPTGLYWIFSEAPEFYVIQNGVILDSSLYQLVKTQKEDDFIVREAGIDKYVIRNLNSKGFETFYPLEFLNN